MLCHELPGPEAARKFLYQFHDEQALAAARLVAFFELPLGAQVTAAAGSFARLAFYTDKPADGILDGAGAAVCLEARGDSYHSPAQGGRAGPHLLTATLLTLTPPSPLPLESPGNRCPIKPLRTD